MSQNLDVLGMAPDEELTKQFIRGSSFLFVMELPAHIQKGQLANYVPTCQLRRLSNGGATGLIADIPVEFTDADCIALQFTNHDTAAWPVGPAEFDVLFTNSTDEQIKHRTLPVRISIENGVTL